MQFWYLTWRFEHSGHAVLQHTLGPTWSVAAYRFIWRSAVGGPRLRRGSAATPSAPVPPYAFRLLDEPTPWNHRSVRPRLRRKASRLPERWSTVPCFAPLDLEDRPSARDHHLAMGAADRNAIVDLAKTTRTAAEQMTDVASIEACIGALRGFRDRFAPGSAEYKRCAEELSAAIDAFDGVLERLVRSCIGHFETTGLMEHVSTAASFLDKMSSSPRKQRLSQELVSLRQPRRHDGHDRPCR
jgi:hypothetical protein